MNFFGYNKEFKNKKKISDEFMFLNVVTFMR